jgi:hypothetical protein
MRNSPIWFALSKFLTDETFNYLENCGVDFECISDCSAIAPAIWNLETNVSVIDSRSWKVEAETEYKSQRTLANASALNDDLRNRIRRNNSNVLNDTAREGVAGVVPK